jgi:hypothetical protein
MKKSGREATDLPFNETFFKISVLLAGLSCWPRSFCAGLARMAAAGYGKFSELRLLNVRFTRAVFLPKVWVAVAWLSLALGQSEVPTDQQ